jgi:4-amino-4-deoxy-L-arabinose transferase-like glycosyltransferase
MNSKNKLVYLLLFLIALIVNFFGINSKFFTDDPALYASIAKHMVERHEFLSLFSYGSDWLDKPHFPFWMVFLSFKLFGISEWAYRLPALLFFTGSVVYTWLFAKKYYGIETASIAALILVTAQHAVMSNTDVRAEPYLMALIIGSIYHISGLHERFKVADLLMAAILTACAIMTKGIFVVVVIYGALLGQLLFQKNVKAIFKLKWVLLVLLTSIFTLPEFYALYQQFDLHPEKLVFGRHHVSGIKWFLWDSQFGRFANNGPITRKSGDIFFFLHTLLWAFAPWCLIFYFGLYKKLKSLINQQNCPEYFTVSGALLLLVLFSLSRFQLPFYTNILFPLFAVICAPFIRKDLSKAAHNFRLLSQWIYIVVFTSIILLISVFFKPQGVWFAVDCLLFANLIFLVAMRVEQVRFKTFFLACATSVYVNLYLGSIIYPEMIAYNGEIAAAAFLNDHAAVPSRIYTFNAGNNIFQFYCKSPVLMTSMDQFDRLDRQIPTFFFADKQTMNTLLQTHKQLKLVKAFRNYPKETLTRDFIISANRSKTLDSVFVLTR